jgi:hypothetical protein
MSPKILNFSILLLIIFITSCKNKKVGFEIIKQDINVFDTVSYIIKNVPPSIKISSELRKSKSNIIKIRFVYFGSSVPDNFFYSFKDLFDKKITLTKINEEPVSYPNLAKGNLISRKDVGYYIIPFSKDVQLPDVFKVEFNELILTGYILFDSIPSNVRKMYNFEIPTSSSFVYYGYEMVKPYKIEGPLHPILIDKSTGDTIFEPMKIIVR